MVCPTVALSLLPVIDDSVHSGPPPADVSGYRLAATAVRGHRAADLADVISSIELAESAASTRADRAI
jgi:hypothetical protein